MGFCRQIALVGELGRDGAAMWGDFHDAWGLASALSRRLDAGIGRPMGWLLVGRWFMERHSGSRRDSNWPMVEEMGEAFVNGQGHAERTEGWHGHWGGAAGVELEAAGGTGGWAGWTVAYLSRILREQEGQEQERGLTQHEG